MQATKDGVGHRRWVVADGYLPEWSQGPKPQMESHGTVSILNTSDQPAKVRLTLYFADREPVGPYRLQVPARRTCHQRFNTLTDPEPVPRGTDFSCVIESDVPVVVQHTRLDTRQDAAALMTTMAFPSD